MAAFHSALNFNVSSERARRGIDRVEKLMRVAACFCFSQSVSLDCSFVAHREKIRTRLKWIPTQKAKGMRRRVPKAPNFEEEEREKKETAV
jgi:hypothetical protein